ncbi:MAG: glutamate 5-kinase [Bacteroidales bacterium]
MKKRLVIKIGTSTLTMGTNRISFAVIEGFAREIVQLREKWEIVIVSSGAIATARQFVEINGFNREVDSKQALAAIGQTKLMELYDNIFSTFGLNIAQILLTYRDFENPLASENTRNTINKLWEVGYIPIVNENDTVSIEEIVVGDNDILSALVARIINANLLILASDIDGIYTGNPYLSKEVKLIEEISQIESIENYIEERESKLGTGGMGSKIEAARLCMERDIEMWIVNGSHKNSLTGAMEKKFPFSKFKKY